MSDAISTGGEAVGEAVALMPLHPTSWPGVKGRGGAVCCSDVFTTEVQQDVVQALRYPVGGVTKSH